MNQVYFANSNDEEFASTGNDRTNFVINQKENIFFIDFHNFITDCTDSVNYKATE